MPLEKAGRCQQTLGPQGWQHSLCFKGSPVVLGPGGTVAPGTAQFHCAVLQGFLEAELRFTMPTFPITSPKKISCLDDWWATGKAEQHRWQGGRLGGNNLMEETV